MTTRGVRTGQAFASFFLATLLWGTAALADNPYFGMSQTSKGHKWGVVARTCDKAGGGTGTFKILGIPVDAGGYTRLKRAEIVAERLNSMYRAGAFTDPDRIYIGRLNGQTVIMVRRDYGSQHIVTVDTNMARYYHKSVRSTALLVRDRLRYCARRIVINADGSTSESGVAIRCAPAVKNPNDFTGGGTNGSEGEDDEDEIEDQ